MKNELIFSVKEFVYNRLFKEGSGHDWTHIERVRRTALVIGKEESANLFIVELAALLHDIIDEKLSNEIRLQLQDVDDFLSEIGIEKKTVKQVLHIINSISFRKHTPSAQLSLEAKVVQDADRLDAIGAIGIARTFTYAGSKGKLIYEPNSDDRQDAISHFYDKLLTLKNIMNTSSGKQLAEERHQFLLTYLQQFYRELNID